MNRAIVVTAGLLLLSLGQESPFAQDSTARTQKAVTGQRIQLSAHFNMNKDCSTTMPPEVRVITPPANGSLTVRTGTLRSPKVGNCTNIEAPSRVVLYQSNAGYTGTDRVEYEVIRQNGTKEIQSVTINVLAAPPAPANPKPKVDQIRLTD